MMPDPYASTLPDDVLESLRAHVPVPDRDRRLDAIMDAVRAERRPAVRAPRWAWPPSLRRLRRGILSPAAGPLVALGLLLAGASESITTAVGAYAGLTAQAYILGDTVIARPVPVLPVTATAAPRRTTLLRDSVVATLYDTLRIVRLALRAPHAAQVALTGAVDTTASVPRVVAHTRSTDGRWELRAIVPRAWAVHSLALLVDGTRRVPIRHTGHVDDRLARSAESRPRDTTL
jgi:hypothetical protein